MIFILSTVFVILNSRAFTWALNYPPVTNVSQRNYANVTNPATYTFELLIEEGLRNIRRHYPNYRIHHILATPSAFQEAALARDINHIRIAFENLENGRYYQETNYIGAPSLWFRPEEHPSMIKYPLELWSWHDRLLKLDTAIQLVLQSGLYMGLFTRAALVKFKKNPFHGSAKREIFVGLRGSDTYSHKWFFVGSETRKVFDWIGDLTFSNGDMIDTILNGTDTN